MGMVGVPIWPSNLRYNNLASEARICLIHKQQMPVKNKMLFHVYVDQKMYDHFKSKAVKAGKCLSTVIREDLEVTMEVDKDFYEYDDVCLVSVKPDVMGVVMEMINEQ